MYTRMTIFMRSHRNYAYVLLGLLIGVLLAGVGSVQATQPELAPSSNVQLAPTPAAECTVVSNRGLNVRSGPGENYHPPIGTLPIGEKVRPLAASRDRQGRTWIQVETTRANPPRGWVLYAPSGGPPYLACPVTVQIDKLPIATNVPPTPSPPRVTPTPTPFRIAYSNAPGVAGNPRGLIGDVWLLGKPGVDVDGEVEYVFRDRLGIEMRVRDPRAARGNGIDHIEFRISSDRVNDDIYFHRENNPPYCLFRDDCVNDWSFQPNGSWPESDSGHPVAEARDRRIDSNAVYRADISVFFGDDQEGNWNFNFRIIPSNRARDAFYTLRSVNSDSNYDAEVRAPYDTVVSDSDRITAFRNPVAFWLVFDDSGDGAVDKVEFEVWNSDKGTVIRRNTEDNPPYCVIGNNNNQPCMPLRLDPGTYQVFMIARDFSSHEIGAWDFQFTVR